MNSIGILQTAPDVVVMIADCHRQNSFGLFLLDHKSIQIVSDLLWFAIKGLNTLELLVPRGGLVFRGWVSGSLLFGLLIVLHTLHKWGKCHLYVFVTKQVA